MLVVGEKNKGGWRNFLGFNENRAGATGGTDRYSIFLGFNNEIYLASLFEKGEGEGPGCNFCMFLRFFFFGG